MARLVQPAECLPESVDLVFDPFGVRGVVFIFQVSLQAFYGQAVLVLLGVAPSPLLVEGRQPRIYELHALDHADAGCRPAAAHRR